MIVETLIKKLNEAKSITNAKSKKSALTSKWPVVINLRSNPLKTLPKT